MSLFEHVCSAYLCLDGADSLAAHEVVARLCSETPSRVEFVQSCVCFLWRHQLDGRLAPGFWQRCMSQDLPGAARELHTTLTVRRTCVSRLDELLATLNVSSILRSLNLDDDLDGDLLMQDADKSAVLVSPMDCAPSVVPPRNAETSRKCVSFMDDTSHMNSTAMTEEHVSKSFRIEEPAPSAGCASFQDFVLSQVNSSLFRSLEPGCGDIVFEFYNRAFTAVRQLKDGEAELNAEGIVQEAVETTRQLTELDIFGPLAGSVVAKLICKQLRERVGAVCEAGFGRGWTAELESWCGVLLADWRSLLPGHLTSDDICPRLVDFTFQAYARRRIDQLFDMIVDFPDSRPALEDLRACLQRGRLHGELAAGLRSSVDARLLHPAANTDDILSAYVSAVRALRLLEPSGVLVELVGAPIRQYLRGRDDTVRCIVSSLTEDGGGPLAEELVSSEPSCVPPDGDMAKWRSWMPYPRDAPPLGDSPVSAQADIISMLVSIYGSKNTFVKEYRKLLADRVLKQTSYDIDREYKYLELLKLRFGESELHDCDVMLKDLFNSQRINSHIHSDEPKADTDADTAQEQMSGGDDDDGDTFPVRALVLSAQFWPDFRDDTLVLPESLEHRLDAYTEQYQLLKGNRTLCWRRQLGTVRLQVELGGRTLDVSVTPAHAVILYHFQERASDAAALSLTELSQLMRLPASTLRRKMALWLSNGVLTEVSVDLFQLNESGGGSVSTNVSVMEDDTESAMTSNEDQKEKNLEMFWNYIVGMLTNLESLPLDRIQSMLRIFAMDGVEQCSAQELRHFLDRKVKQHKLLFSGGLYRLPKA